MAALGGNVQPAVVALLYAGLERRWGPGVIGVAASLKLFPILFVAVYVARRQWVAAAAAVGLGGFLWLPALARDIRHYPVEVGGAFSLLAISPVVYMAAIAVTVGLVHGDLASWGRCREWPWSWCVLRPFHPVSAGLPAVLATAAGEPVADVPG